jgi:hypothetical protein
MADRVAMGYSESLQQIAQKYREAAEPWPATARQMARWAYRRKLWEPQEKNIIGQLARDLARALREEYYTDPKGRRVRTKHAARLADDGLLDGDGSALTQQRVFWADIRTDDPKHLEAALKQRRMGIVGDCKQLRTDVDSFNDFHPSGRKIQMIFNFEDDLAEMDEPTEYQPSLSAKEDEG